MHVCMYACMYLCIYVCTYVCMSVCIYVCMHVCIYVSTVCMYVHVCALKAFSQHEIVIYCTRHIYNK